jgi:hypothetical protein
MVDNKEENVFKILDEVERYLLRRAADTHIHVKVNSGINTLPIWIHDRFIELRDRYESKTIINQDA